MKSKQDIQLELLAEIDDICSKNGLKYILIGQTALNAYLNHTVKNGTRMMSVAMTMGDMDRFCEIIENEYSDDRYVEGMFNNPKFNPSFINYGNKNTTYFNMVYLDNNIHNGIEVRIYPIRKHAELDGTIIKGWSKRLARERKFRLTLNRIIVSDKFWHLKLATNVLNKIYAVTGGHKRYYNEIKNRIFIDKWENIQDYSMVRFLKYNISSEILKETVKYDVDGIKLCLPKCTDEFFTEMYNENFREKEIKEQKIKRTVIVDTEIEYEKVIEATKDIITEARICHEEVVWERRKHDDEKTAVANIWRLVKMTNRQLEFKRYFKNNIDYLLTLDLDDEEQFEEVYEELKKPISTLRRYSKFGMTFSIDPKTDALIDEVLVKSGREKLRNKINKISNKKYFVE